MMWQGNHRLHLAVCGLASAAIGVSAGYVAASRILEKAFQERLEAEIQDAKAFFQDMYSTPVFEKHEAPEEELLERVRTSTQEHDGPPVDLVGQALAAVATYDPAAEEEAREEEARHSPVVVNNIFQQATPAGDEVLAALEADRDPSKPYIITREEFLADDPDHEQVPFTYWAGDDILVDDRQEYQPIEEIDQIAGEDNLLRFGYGSGDENVLYIRNEGIKMDLHITLSTGKYAEEVMAFNNDETHLEHSIKRFRPYHDD